ncbi:MAG: hypothetical protein WCO68_07770 [Verrucomicrobiota bacterium]
MKRFIFALLSAVLLAAPAFASGPWDAGVPGNTTKVNPSNPTGTYQGSIKGVNIAGIFRVGTSPSGSTAAPGYYSYYIHGSGSNTIVTSQYTPGSAAGIATLFMEGASGVANVDAIVDLAGRTLSGVMDGGTTRAKQLAVTNPHFKYVITLTSTNSFGVPVITSSTISAPGKWVVTDNASFSGYFNAKLSKNWAANTFSGSGLLTISKFDLDQFTAQVSSTDSSVASAATPDGNVSSHDVNIKVAGSKTANTTNLSAVTIPDGQPVIKQITP